MASKGESKSQKRLSVSTARTLHRKEKVFTTKTRGGAHNKGTSMPLSILLRDALQLVSSQREANYLLQHSQVMVDGVRRTAPKFNVGLFDVVDLVEEKKRYRILFDTKGRLYAKEIPAKDRLFKLCKIMGKRALGKDLFQYSMHDGNNLRAKGGKMGVGSTVKISLPEKKVEEVLELKKGNLVYATKGKHVGTVAKVTGLTAGTMTRPGLVTLEMDKEEFQTVTGNVFVVGSGKLEVELGE